ncbi:hypothetical protein JTB14_035872 [Gonioctena quinquepunctata]|nr:hypothetical protein JTB14_035872 [Gonioctena quinquepunctata]
MLVPSKPIPNEIPSSSKVHLVMENIPSISMASQFQNEENENPVISLPERQEEPKRKRKRPTSSYTKRNDILTDIKIDLKAYYAEKLSMQRDKLGIEKRKLEDR